MSDTPTSEWAGRTTQSTEPARAIAVRALDSLPMLGPVHAAVGAFGSFDKSMIESLAIPAPSELTVTISGGWTRRSSWDWVGTLVAPDPIVGMAFLRVANHVEWVRSEKTAHPELEIRWLLGRYDSTGLDVQPCFSIGGNSVRWRAMLNDADDLPSIPETRPIQVG